MAVFRVNDTRNEIQQTAGNLPLGLGQVQHHKLHVSEEVSNFGGVLILLGSNKNHLHVGNTVNRLDPFGFPTLLIFLIGVAFFVIFVQVLFFRFPAQCAKE